ncbi:hypothetical protein J3P71_21815 [Rhizobium leguminosarum]|uniref:hypothetical protein n=1 Tax=Rhizobium leguminosarum TaxID=384 RepID=UPI00197FFA97|nr:hypothetical protein [Rhizobium leguminosarum]QSZ10952.1 hypothetical protein J3P71_21815 [Rhizobium leguminosarum]
MTVEEPALKVSSRSVDAMFSRLRAGVTIAELGAGASDGKVFIHPRMGFVAGLEAHRHRRRKDRHDASDHGQGAAAEVVAMVTIVSADHLGPPASDCDRLRAVILRQVF